MLKKTVHRASEKLNTMDQTLNKPDPRFVTAKKNGEDVIAEKIDIQAKHCHTYLGKMQMNGK